MKSPFPGMDPFMERRWLNAHASLIVYIRDQLQSVLPPELVAETNERVLLEQSDGDVGEALVIGGAYPDVKVTEPSTGVTALATLPEIDLEQGAPTGILTFEFDYPEKQNFIEIVDAETRTKVITVIELISPSNKRSGPGRDSYLAKQTATLRSAAHLVEIDLTRAGDRATIMPWCTSLPQPWPAYLAGVYRAQTKWQHRLEYHALPLDAPLKAIAIPLRPQDRDVVLRLQPLVEQTWQNGGYRQTNYSAKLNPPLSSAEQAFLAQRLADRQ